MTYLESFLLPLYRWVDQNRTALFRFLVIPSVLIAVAFLVPKIFVGNRYPALILVALLFLVVLIAFLRQPILGLIAIFLGGMFIPTGFGVRHPPDYAQTSIGSGSSENFMVWGS